MVLGCKNTHKSGSTFNEHEMLFVYDTKQKEESIRFHMLITFELCTCGGASWHVSVNKLWKNVGAVRKTFRLLKSLLGAQRAHTQRAPHVAEVAILI